MGAAINTPIDDSDRQLKPWYRYGWPWFLISIPFVSVALGGMMLYLALSTNNSLVVDDYYKEGKGINLRIERDRTAALLGLAATLTRSAEGLLLDVSRRVPVLPANLQDEANAVGNGFHWPAAVQVQWVHVTQSERDGEMTMQAIGGDRYLAAGAILPDEGNFRLHVKPVDNAPWRLVSKLVNLQGASTVSIPARQPAEVFNRSEFE